VPDALHRFLVAYIRYAVHVQAYVYVVGRRFPGFTGRPGSYGIDLELAPRHSQSRWVTLFRLFLAIPALLLAGALAGVLFVAGVLGWWYALATGRMPEGLRNLGAACIRYQEQASAYLLLVTDRTPTARPCSAAGRQSRARPSPRRRSSETPSEERLHCPARRGARRQRGPPYPTAVPDGLSLPAVDVDDTFGAELVEKTRHYERFLYVDWVLPRSRSS
jgi:hypothetical protein